MYHGAPNLACAHQNMLLLISLLHSVSCCAGSNEQHVYPRILEERISTGNVVLQISDEITLNLEKSDVVGHSIMFVTTTKEAQKVETVDTSHIEENIYHDPIYQSSLMVRQKDGNVEVEGIINDNLRIRPLPEGERSLQGQMLHKIFEVEPLEEKFIKAEPRIPILNRRYNLTNSRKDTNGKEGTDTPEKRDSAKDEFLVELHIVSDQKHQNSYKTNDELITYMALMTNAANLRYLDMTNPRIKFLLVGVTRAKNYDFAQSRNGVIDADKMLTEFKNYKSQGRIPGNHDVAYLATALDMASNERGQLDRTLLGLANFATVCRANGVGEGEDTPLSFNGVNSMAHELAHTLGSPHDETPECPWSQGYLMSYVDGGLRKYRLSPCSERKIRNYLRVLSEECFKVLSHMNYANEHRKYPGQSVRPQYLCRKLLKVAGGAGKKITARPGANCKLQCCDRSYGGCRQYPMPEGMECVKGKTCKRGVCGVHTWSF